MAESGIIVVGVGLTGESGYVLEKVAQLADDPQRIVAAHVIDHTPFVYEDGSGVYANDSLSVQVEDESRERLARLCERFHIERHEILSGHPAAELHRYAECHAASIIVVGTHGRQGWRALLGETANAVLHGTTTNVLAVYTPDELPSVVPSYRKILAAIDLSDESPEILAAAKRVADRFGAELEILTVIRPLRQLYHGIELSTETDANVFEGQVYDESLRRSQKIMAAHDLADCKLHLNRGDPAIEIHLVAEQTGSDLIVLGTHGTHGPALLFGSTANAVLHGVRQDVLAIRVGREHDG